MCSLESEPFGFHSLSSHSLRCSLLSHPGYVMLGPLRQAQFRHREHHDSVEDAVKKMILRGLDLPPRSFQARALPLASATPRSQRRGARGANVRALSALLSSFAAVFGALTVAEACKSECFWCPLRGDAGRVCRALLATLRRRHKYSL